MTTDLLFLRDAYERSVRAVVTHVDGVRVTLDRTVFYPTGGGQPHDTGTLTWPGGAARVTEVRKEGADVWHTLDGDLPAPGAEVAGEIDWDRRHRLMRARARLISAGRVDHCGRRHGLRRSRAARRRPAGRGRAG